MIGWENAGKLKFNSYNPLFFFSFIVVDVVVVSVELLQFNFVTGHITYYICRFLLSGIY